MAKGKYNARKRKVKKNVPNGVVHIKSTFNNTVVTVTDLEGNTLCWASYCISIFIRNCNDCIIKC